MTYDGLSGGFRLFGDSLSGGLRWRGGWWVPQSNWVINLKTRKQLEIKFSILLTSVFSDEQNAVRRKKFFIMVTMNPEAIRTSEFNRKKFQIR